MRSPSTVLPDGIVQSTLETPTTGARHALFDFAISMLGGLVMLAGFALVHGLWAHHRVLGVAISLSVVGGTILGVPKLRLRLLGATSRPTKGYVAAKFCLDCVAFFALTSALDLLLDGHVLWYRLVGRVFVALLVAYNGIPGRKLSKPNGPPEFNEPTANQDFVS